MKISNLSVEFVLYLSWRRARETPHNCCIQALAVAIVPMHSTIIVIEYISRCIILAGQSSRKHVFFIILIKNKLPYREEIFAGI